MIRVVIELMEPMKEVPLINLACGESELERSVRG